MFFNIRSNFQLGLETKNVQSESLNRFWCLILVALRCTTVKLGLNWDIRCTFKILSFISQEINKPKVQNMYFLTLSEWRENQVHRYENIWTFPLVKAYWSSSQRRFTLKQTAVLRVPTKIFPKIIIVCFAGYLTCFSVIQHDSEPGQW